jgi:MFS transporter, DHA1 family, tetracycline resistance protein
MSVSGGRLGVIFLTVLIDLIGFGIVMPILPFYAQEFGARGLELGLLMGSFSGMQFAATMILGRLSDRTGRRPILLLTMALSVAGYVLFANAGSFLVLLLARLVSGFAGGNISVAQAYIADTTTPAERSKGMGIIGAAFGLGFIIGPAIGGLAGHYWGHAAPGYVAAGLALLNLVLAWRILPESLHEQHRTRRSLFSVAHIRDGLADRRLRALLLVWLLAPVAFAGYTAVLPLYTSVRFGWTARELGWLFVVIGVVAAIVQGWAFARMARRTGDRFLLIAGNAGMALAIATMSLAPTPFALYGLTAVLAFSNSVFGPAASGMVSVLADPTEQGTVLGVAQSLGALGRLLGPEAFGGLYDVAGATPAFVAAGGVMLVSALAAARVPRAG